MTASIAGRLDAVEATETLTHTLDWSGGVTDGRGPLADDLAIVFMAMQWATDVTAPAGWTTIVVDKQTSGDDRTGCIFTKVLDDDDISAGSFDFTTATPRESVSTLLIIENYDGTTPLEALGANSRSWQLPCNSGPYTTTVDDSLALSFIVFGTGIAASNSITMSGEPVGMEYVTDFLTSSNGGNSVGMRLSEVAEATAVARAAGYFTWAGFGSGDYGLAYGLVVRPGSAGGTPDTGGGGAVPAGGGGGRGDYAQAAPIMRRGEDERKNRMFMRAQG